MWALAPLSVAVCADHLKVDSFGMRRLADASGNGFELLFHDMQRVSFLKLGSMAWVLRMRVGEATEPLKSVCKTYMSFEGRGLFRFSRV